MFSENLNRDEKWEAVYRLALLEVDRQKMPERIFAARHAIEKRLQGLAGDPDHHAERQQVEDALRALAVIENESQRW